MWELKNRRLLLQTKIIRMNKILTLLIAISISTATYSQDFESGDINKKSYVRIGLSTPSWQYYGFNDKNDMSDNISDFLFEKNPDLGVSQLKGRIGGIFEIGVIFPLNGINVGDHLRFGINVDWLTLKAQVFNLQGSKNIYNAFAASKIGPSFTYAPSKAIAFDIYGKVSPVWAAAVYNNHQNAEGNIDIYRGFVQFMYTAGVNVKIAIIMIGFEYEFGSLQLKNSNDEYYGNVQSGSKKTPMSGFNATIGFCF